MSKQTVFIVDDDEAVRDSIAELLDSVGLAYRAFDSGQAFLDIYQADQGGCLVLDVRMAHISGLALQQRLNEEKATLPIIFISGHGDIPMAVSALKAGAVDFLPKPYRDDQLLDAINDALALDAERRAGEGPEGLRQQLATLTPREHEVLDQLLTGRTGKEVARELAISPRTVEVHRQRIARKFGVRTVQALISLFNQGSGLRA